MITFYVETSQHRSCCLKKEVAGIQYKHIYDHGMILPEDCKDHCVYKDSEDKLWCFGEGGDLTAKCLAQGEPEECSSVFVGPQRTSKKKCIEIKSKTPKYPR